MQDKIIKLLQEREYVPSNVATTIDLSESETIFIKEILSAYPLVPNESRELTRSADTSDLEEDTELLRTSLADLTRGHQKKLQAWVNAPETFREVENRYLFRITNDNRDWFLQILNDLRIGSWQQLDCPSQEELQELTASQEVIRPLWTMELAGLLQSFLLNSPGNR
ncbi:hypothetical protein N8642_05120 [bacterium]|nr:hypothetical protein [bacterium]